jgi:hypothetical protein
MTSDREDGGGSASLFPEFNLRFLVLLAITFHSVSLSPNLLVVDLDGLRCVEKFWKCKDNGQQSIQCIMN